MEGSGVAEIALWLDALFFTISWIFGKWAWEKVLLPGPVKKMFPVVMCISTVHTFLDLATIGAKTCSIGPG